MPPKSKLKLYSREFLLNDTPSRRDGYDLAKEDGVRKKCYVLIRKQHEVKLKL